MNGCYIPLTLAADISDAATTVQRTFEAPYAGRINVERSYIEWTEATGTQTTTAGRVDLRANAVVIGSVTANLSDAVGETQTFVVDGTVATAAQPYVTFTAGQDISTIIGVQAVDGTIVGDGTAQVWVEYAG